MAVLGIMGLGHVGWKDKWKSNHMESFYFQFIPLEKEIKKYLNTHNAISPQKGKYVFP